MHTSEQTYHQACRFHDASQILSNFSTANSASNPVSAHIHIPNTALVGFTCELYLKSLIHYQTGEPEKGHELHKLFSRIQEPLKTNLRIILENIDGIVKEDFYSELIVVSDIFTKWRYFNEGMPTGTFNTSILHAISFFCRDFLGRHNPEWVVHYNAINHIDNSQDAPDNS